jgi:hypothetical protein
MVLGYRLLPMLVANLGDQLILLRLLVSGLIGLVGACASAPTGQELAAADVGPLPSNYEQLVKDNFATSLFDPYSAVYSFTQTPFRGYAGNAVDGAKIGWIVCGTVNAKNRMGGYVGARPFLFVISNGAVIGREIESRNATRCVAGQRS